MELGADLDFPRAAAERIANAAEGGTGDVRRRGCEAGRVGQVVSVSTELELDPLFEREALEQRRVHLKVARGQEEVAAEIAELAGAGGGELGALGGVEVPHQAIRRIGERRAVAAVAAGAVCRRLDDVA